MCAQKLKYKHGRGYRLVFVIVQYALKAIFKILYRVSATGLDKIPKKGKYIICRDLSTLILVMGTSSVSGSLNCYGVKKEGNKWIVSIDKIKERITELETRKNNIEAKLEIMKQVVR